ncbi:2646_t:CDS:2 [Ambispora leptoticha]|uniref:2646_t:CDS:1 n=1 Tax=Ambispora leptoticha TaxID=144679 RepID=A0A9N9F5Z0_9GLOM|nr:2646_t:CDS:2 [Ambispora leptoticha]
MPSNTITMSKENDLTQRVVLNVGGIKYETLRSTLTAYPNTLLGTMFADRNETLLKPENGNEYFFDRNGRAFHYIMEYYRTGKLLFPTLSDNLTNNFWITKEEIQKELDYFLIGGLFEQEFKEMHLTLSKHLNTFVALIEDSILKNIRKMENISCFVMFFKISEDPKNANNTLTNFPFEHKIAYQLASNFSTEISKHLQEIFTGSKVSSTSKFDGRTSCYWEFYITLNYNKAFILNNSNLKVNF